MKRATLALALTASIVGGPDAMAQQFKPAALAARAVRGGVYWIDGGVANAGFVVGDKGVVVIDTQISPADARTAIAAIAKVTPKPVTAVVVSHGDPDHIGGLAAYPAGAAVIEQEGTVAYVRAAADDAVHGGPFGAMYRELIARPPTRTIGDTATIVQDGVRMVLIHVGPAHTNGDLVVYLPAQRTVFGADILLTSQRFPVIHLGGSTLGWIATMKAVLALDADTYIPGHGPIEPKAKLTARLHDVEQARDAIKAMVAAGRPLAEIQGAYPETPSPFPTFVETVYRELTTGYPAPVPPWGNVVRPQLMGR